MAIGKQIKHYREKLGLTQKDLAALAQVDIGTISALETRDSNRSSYFPALAQALGLTVEQLQDGRLDHVCQRTSKPHKPWPERPPYQPPRVDEAAGPSLDIWLATAFIQLQKIAPQFRAQTLEYIELQAKKTVRGDGKNLPSAG